jgi:hypothetical protein
MEPVELTPEYSSLNVSGKCLRCLTAKEVDHCLYRLLDTETIDETLLEKFKLLIELFDSPDLQRWIDASESYLSDGKQVSIKVSREDGQIKCEIVTEENRRDT